MMGGKVYEVDFMFARPVNPGLANALDSSLLLRLPSTNKGGVVEMVIPPKEEEFIKQALLTACPGHLYLGASTAG